MSLLLSDKVTVGCNDRSLHFAFHEVNGELYVVLGDTPELDVVDVGDKRTTYPDLSKSATVFRLSLRDELEIKDMIEGPSAKAKATRYNLRDPKSYARIIFESAVEATQINESSLLSRTENFRK